MTECSALLASLKAANLGDDWWMYQYKVVPCPHGYRHAWSQCPFAHQGETARRRCPRSYAYSPEPCPSGLAKGRGGKPCPLGDQCKWAHNTFECWLHPARYRTRLCYLGSECVRPTCFFAHTVAELRPSPEDSDFLLTPASAASALSAAGPSSSDEATSLVARFRGSDSASQADAGTGNPSALTHTPALSAPEAGSPWCMPVFMSNDSSSKSLGRAGLPLPTPASGSPTHSAQSSEDLSLFRTNADCQAAARAALMAPGPSFALVPPRQAPQGSSDSTPRHSLPGALSAESLGAAAARVLASSHSGVGSPLVSGASGTLPEGVPDASCLSEPLPTGLMSYSGMSVAADGMSAMEMMRGLSGLSGPAGGGDLGYRHSPSGSLEASSPLPTGAGGDMHLRQHMHAGKVGQPFHSGLMGPQPEGPLSPYQQQQRPLGGPGGQYWQVSPAHLQGQGQAALAAAGRASVDGAGRTLEWPAQDATRQHLRATRYSASGNMGSSGQRVAAAAAAHVRVQRDGFLTGSSSARGFMSVSGVGSASPAPQLTEGRGPYGLHSPLPGAAGLAQRSSLPSQHLAKVPSLQHLPHSGALQMQMHVAPPARGAGSHGLGVRMEPLPEDELRAMLPLLQAVLDQGLSAGQLAIVDGRVLLTGEAGMKPRRVQ